MTAKLRAWLILSRGSNLPTVWSNLFVGWLLAFVFAQHIPGIIPATLSLFGLWLGVSLTYVGGMILNDAFDAKWDAEHRPSRPIPSGLISLRTAYVVGGLGLLLGFLITVRSCYTDGRDALAAGSHVLAAHRALLVKLAFALTVSVLVYNRWHKQVAWAPAVMGLCRALLPAIGFCALADADQAWHTARLFALIAHPLVLWLLTFSITLVARHESGNGQPPRWAEFLLYLVPLPLLIAASSLGAQPSLRLTLFGCALYWLWIYRSNRKHPLPAGVGARVSDRLASFPLLDLAANSLFLFYTAQMYGSESTLQNAYLGVTRSSGLFWWLPLGCFGLTLLFRRWIPTT
ncbi:MAG: UbiA family prenyltransferase [Verrucomicrobiota bacterium]|jgi:4-hydroxybenzoate polyprenyltransferase